MQEFKRKLFIFFIFFNLSLFADIADSDAFNIISWPPGEIFFRSGFAKIQNNLYWLYSGAGYWFFKEKETDGSYSNAFFKGKLETIYDRKKCSGTPSKYDIEKLVFANTLYCRLDLTADVKNYKIHLMPKKEDLLFTINKFLNNTKNDTEFHNLIYTFKVINVFDQYKSIHRKYVMPIIVIYAASGKENAQKLLDKIYNLFKNQEGLNETPRWNEKVTSLIYFAQGNGDDKKIKAYEKLFEPGDDEGNGRVYFMSDVTGAYEDYHLINPGKKETEEKVSKEKAEKEKKEKENKEQILKEQKKIYAEKEKLEKEQQKKIEKLAKEKLEKEKLAQEIKLKQQQAQKAEKIKVKQFKNVLNILTNQANILQQFKQVQANKNTKKINQLKPQVQKIRQSLIKMPLNITNAQGQTPIMLNPKIAFILPEIAKPRSKIVANAKDAKGKRVIQYVIQSNLSDNIVIYKLLSDSGIVVTKNDIGLINNKLKSKPKIRNQIINIFKK